MIASALRRSVVRSNLRCVRHARLFSSSLPLRQSANADEPMTPQPPSELNQDMAMGIQNTTELYLRFGLGKQRLEEISTDKESHLVLKWQKMMEAFLGTQVHVLAGLGYSPDEQGLSLYNQHLTTFVQSCDPDLSETFRQKGRDNWRTVLSTAFALDMDGFEEMPIVDARNIMHKVSMKMQEESILDKVATLCACIEPNDNVQIEMAQKHNIVQEVLVNDVYLGGEPSLVEECGFGAGEQGYVRMQCVMSEHQTDPLVAQYVGTSMMKLLTSAGIDVGTAAQQAQK